MTKYLEQGVRCQNGAKKTPANVCYSQEFFLPAFDLIMKKSGKENRKSCSMK